MKKKRIEKRRPTDEEMSRAADTKLKRYITRSALEWADRDPEIKRQMVAQTFGYKLPDQAEKKQRELIAYIDELAIQKLKEDHKLAQIVVDARLRQVTEEMGLEIEGEEWRRKPLSVDDYIERAKKFKELKEVMGVKEPGFVDAFTDPKVIVAALQLISELVGNKQVSPTNNVVLVSEDGEEKEMTRQEYEQLKDGCDTVNLKDMEIGEPISPGRGNDTASESETSNKADEGGGETGAAGSVK